VGSGLANGLGVGVGVGVGVGDPLGDGLGLALADWVSVPLGEADAVGVGVPAGENEDEAAAKGVPPEQAETATEVSMVMVLQPMTANLALCLAAAPVVRTFMKPPRTSPQVAAISGTRHHEPAPGGTTRPGRCPRQPKTAPRKRRRP
jgi:hypothetical protein